MSRTTKITDASNISSQPSINGKKLNNNSCENVERRNNYIDEISTVTATSSSSAPAESKCVFARRILTFQYRQSHSLVTRNDV